MTKLLFLSGSTRTGSYNSILAKKAYEIAKQDSSIEAIYVDLKDYDMPIYNGDLEAASGLPENAKKLKELFVECSGFFIAAPEYNSSITPLLKNSLDWISRPSSPKEQSLIAYAGKVAALSSASPSGWGGMRGLVSLRMMLGNINVLLVPSQVCISAANTAFDEQQNFKDAKHLKALENLVNSFIVTAVKQTANK